VKNPHEKNSCIQNFCVKNLCRKNSHKQTSHRKNSHREKKFERESHATILLRHVKVKQNDVAILEEAQTQKPVN
jgi:hypothetical protein